MAAQVFPLDDRGSFAWLADPAEPIERASAAIAIDGGSIVVDPVDFPGLDEALVPLAPTGVVTLLDRHRRDAEALSARLGVPRLLPLALGGQGLRLRGVEERTVVAGRWWKEVLLWLPDRRLLVCAETLGTGRFFLVRDGDRLGLHPLARLLSLRGAFADLEPAAVAVGHGAPLLGEAGPELRSLLARARRDLPRAWARAARLALRAGAG